MRTRLNVRSYKAGFLDGVETTLQQLLDTSPLAPQGGYRGPVPGELRDWIAVSLSYVEGVRVEDGLPGRP